MLLAAGADKNAPDYERATPIYDASQVGHHEVVELLHAAGADQNTPLKEEHLYGLHLSQLQEKKKST